MELPIFQVDAFTGRLFGGNPAAVVLLPQWLPDATLQAIAAENNLAETAFVVPLQGAFGLRWFTPEVEIDLCGHATLASAHVLFHHGYAAPPEIVFQYQGGTLTVTQAGDLLAMRFPARPPQPAPCDAALVAALGATPREVHRARDLLAVFETQDEVEALRPDVQAIAALDAFAVIVSAPGQACDFVSRFFAPRAGIPEDPATGSSHCTLVPYWSARLGKPRLHALQLSRRRGELFCEHQGAWVQIAGRAVEYLRGHIVL
jgi:PhzF family phenazine biosynthesis protein